MAGTRTTNSPAPAPAKKAPKKAAPKPTPKTPKTATKVATKKVAAPKAPLPQITAWSYSRWRDYEQCPAKAKYKHIDRIKEPGSKAMDRGSDIHKSAENFVKGLAKTLCAELKNFAAHIRKLKKDNAEAEGEWAFSAGWRSMVSWFSGMAWCRIKIDVFALSKDRKRFRVVDYKTGRIYDDNIEQTELYALGAFKNPALNEIEAVDVELWYVDQPIQIGVNPVVKTFPRTEEPALEALWEKRTKAMFMDRRFAPRPNDKCRWCWFRKGNTEYPGGHGPCQF